ncbi:hypothetical protein, partial [Methylophaga sp. SB9B]|uniref:hypothetical protein n=1 Tax=Methylophaga sp. SB9B TaxID=2570356 RepID=UPI001B3C17B5
MILKNTFSALAMFTATVLILAYQTSVQAKPLIDQRYSDNGDGTITDTKTNGFYPDFADTSKKPDNGQKECLCRREENTVRSSNVVQLNRPCS